MRRMKKFAAITMLAAVMTVGVPQANAGILMADFANTDTKNNVQNTPVKQPQVSLAKSIILMLEGILMSD